MKITKPKGPPPLTAKLRGVSQYKKKGARQADHYAQGTEDSIQQLIQAHLWQTVVSFIIGRVAAKQRAGPIVALPR